MTSELVSRYFPGLSQLQRQQFDQLPDLYAYWNSRINVISRKDIESLPERHVLHSLGIAKVLSFLPGERIMDVGTGGGFPGIPLAILFPESHFHLVDSIGKKIKVVKEVAAATGLTNVTAEAIRAEQVGGTFNFIVSRAVTRLAEFYPWISSKFNRAGHNKLPNGLFYLKGGDLSDEIAESGLQVRQFFLRDYFNGEFFQTKQVIYVQPR